MIKRNNPKKTARPSSFQLTPNHPAKKPSLARKVGKWFAVAALTGLASMGAMKLKGERVALGQERPAIAKIYGLNEQKAIDKKTLDFIDNISKSEHISRRRVLETIERNELTDHQIWAIRNKIQTESNPALRERLAKIERIILKASADSSIKNRIGEMMSKDGTLDKVRRHFQE